MIRAVQQLLAAGCFEMLVGALGFIGFIVWIINLLAKAVPKAPQEAPPAAPAGSRKASAGGLQKEIDIFLRQVSPKGAGQSAPERQTPRQATTQSDRIPPTQSARRAAGAGPARKETPPPRSRHSKSEPVPAAQKNRGRENLGADVGQHVSRHLDSHPLSERVEDDLRSRVQQSVDAHLGASTGTQGRSPIAASMSSESEETEAQTALVNAREFRRLLRQPAQIRQAILLNEILSRPLALRRLPGAR